jgi:hypothetical protein
MIRSEEWLRALSMMNKKTRTIWGRENRAGDGWKLYRSGPSEGSVDQIFLREGEMTPELESDEGKDASL